MEKKILPLLLLLSLSSFIISIISYSKRVNHVHYLTEKDYAIFKKLKKIGMSLTGKNNNDTNTFNLNTSKMVEGSIENLINLGFYPEHSLPIIIDNSHNKQKELNIQYLITVDLQLNYNSKSMIILYELIKKTQKTHEQIVLKFIYDDNYLVNVKFVCISIYVNKKRIFICVNYLVFDY